MNVKPLSRWQKQLVCKLVSYYKNNQHYHLEYQEQWRLVPASAPKFFQIIAREHFKESTEKLPITDRKSLKGLLALRQKKQGNQKAIFQARAQDDVSTTINAWYPQSSIQSGAWQFPETALLAQTMSEQALLLVNERYYLAVRNNVVYSAMKQGLINSEERFANTMGIKQQSCNRISDENTLIDYLAAGVLPLLLNSHTSFFQANGIKQYKEPFKKGVLMSLVGGCAYLLLSSGYLIMKQSLLQDDLDKNQLEIDQALVSYSKLEEHQRQVAALQSVFVNQPKISPNLLILEKLRDSATIEKMEFKGERFVIRGKSDSAIAVLEQLSSVKWVSEAKFDFPVRSYQGKEEFVISYDVPFKAHKMAFTHKVAKESIGE